MPPFGMWEIESGNIYPASAYAKHIQSIDGSFAAKPTQHKGANTMYDRLGEVTRQHQNASLHRRDIDWLIEQAGKVEKFEKALDRIGFYCAGSEHPEVSEFVLRVKKGEEPFL